MQQRLNQCIPQMSDYFGDISFKKVHFGNYLKEKNLEDSYLHFSFK